MSGYRSFRNWVTVGTLALVSLAVALLAAPTAAAELREAPVVVPDAPTSAPMMLASTGLDITVPVVIGLVALLLGTLMVGWAFLATGRRGQHR